MDYCSYDMTQVDQKLAGVKSIVMHFKLFSATRENCEANLEEKHITTDKIK
jgi:hypothetical protein